MADEESYTIYEDRKGKREKKPFPGWVYFTRYEWTPKGMSMSTGINQGLRLNSAQRGAIQRGGGE